MEQRGLTLRVLQAYTRKKAHQPEVPFEYVLKLMEEVGELAEAILKDKRMQQERIKGTLEEELADVLAYLVAIANVYEVDLEHAVLLKEALNREKYGHPPLEETLNPEGAADRT